MTITKRMLTGCTVAVVTIVVGAWTLGAGPRAASAQVDLVDIYQQHFDARNAGDLDGAMALLTEDAVFEGSVGCSASAPCVGTEAIRAELESFSAQNAQVTISSAELTDDTVTSQWELTSDCTQAAGMERFTGSATVQFAGDKISSFVAENDLTVITNEQLAAYVSCVEALAQPDEMPAAGSGGFLMQNGSEIPTWWYAVAAVGALLVLGGLAVQMRMRRHE